MTETQFHKITEWQKKTFPNATPQSKIAHLAEELIEVMEALRNKDNVQHEFADCFFLLFGAAAEAGMTYTDICKAIEEKFEINRARKWGEPDENGVVKHIK